MKHLLLTTIAAVVLVGCGNPEADRALLDASEKENIEAVKQHLDAGADVNAKDDGGDTPLDMVEGEEIADILREHGGRTGHELAPVFRLDYSTDQWPFGFTFAAKDGMAYVVEVTQDFKQWGVLETIEGTGKQVKFIDSRQPLVPFKRSFYRVKEVE